MVQRFDSVTNPMNHSANTRAAESDYREYAPPQSLADHFLCLWTQSITGCHSEYAQRVLPDGCIDIVFINDEAPMLVGPRSPLRLSELAGIRVVRLRCSAFPPLSCLTNPWHYATFGVLRSVRHLSRFPSSQISVREDRHLKTCCSVSWRMRHPATR